jgi:phage internal scaffolding protein
MPTMQKSENKTTQQTQRRPHAIYWPGGTSKTQQQFTKDADINNIVNKYKTTGILGDPLAINGRKMYFGDFSNIPNYAEVKQMVVDAERRFMSLDPKVRAKFRNNPQEALDFLADPANQKEAEELGLITPMEVKVQQKKEDEQVEKSQPEKKA